MNKVPSMDGFCWVGGGILIIKGKIVVPFEKRTITELDVE